MKRIFLIILLSTIQALSLFAEHIAPSTAMTEAEQFFYAKTKVGDGKLEMVYQSNELYIINNLHTGFVIIAADDRARKILAYSYDNIFTIEGAPENLQAWLNDTEYQIRLAVNNNLPKYSEPDRAKSMSPILLETALWDQKYPFNLMCPKYRTGGEYCTTGCTNTATAILMRYHKWPKAGVGELPGYEYSVNGHYYQKGHLLGHIYDWDCMPVAPQKSYTKYQEQQLSQIMFDIGVMNEAHWNPYHSETALENITRLSKYFGYDKSIEYSIRLMYSDSEWKKMIIDALHTFGPVIYSGGNPDGNGHAYIIDGHDGNEYFHINFGW